jgi:hypothetical protein
VERASLELRSRDVRDLSPGRCPPGRGRSDRGRSCPAPLRLGVSPGGASEGEAACRSTKVMGSGPGGDRTLTAGRIQYCCISVASQFFVLLTHVSFVDPEQSTVFRQMSFVPSQVFALVFVPPELDDRP